MFVEVKVCLNIKESCTWLSVVLVRACPMYGIDVSAEGGHMPTHHELGQMYRAMKKVPQRTHSLRHKNVSSIHKIILGNILFHHKHCSSDLCTKTILKCQVFMMNNLTMLSTVNKIAITTQITCSSDVGCHIIPMYFKKIV